MTAGACEELNLSSVVESLMISHRERWLRFVLRVVQNPEDAEDVLQEAALRMLLRARRFQSLDQARMYLGRIVSNIAIEFYHSRRRAQHQRRPLLEHLHCASSHGEPERLLFEREKLTANVRVLELVYEGLGRLPVKQYEAVRLTILDPDAVSMHNAGIENNIPYSTLRHRSIQGIRQLRRFLARSLRSSSSRLIAAGQQLRRYSGAKC